MIQWRKTRQERISPWSETTCEHRLQANQPRQPLEVSPVLGHRSSASLLASSHPHCVRAKTTQCPHPHSRQLLTCSGRYQAVHSSRAEELTFIHLLLHSLMSESNALSFPCTRYEELGFSVFVTELQKPSRLHLLVHVDWGKKYIETPADVVLLLIKHISVTETL